MMSRAIMLAAIAACGVGYAYQKKAKAKSEMFDRIEKCQKFNVDYV